MHTCAGCRYELSSGSLKSVCQGAGAAGTSKWSNATGECTELGEQQQQSLAAKLKWCAAGVMVLVTVTVVVVAIGQ
jgi:hypothetical protein